jgi:hypothetical protein
MKTLNLNKLLNDDANDDVHDDVYCQYVEKITHHISLIILILFLFHQDIYEQMTQLTKLLQKLESQ